MARRRAYPMRPRRRGAGLAQRRPARRACREQPPCHLRAADALEPDRDGRHAEHRRGHVPRRSCARGARRGAEQLRGSGCARGRGGAPRKPRRQCARAVASADSFVDREWGYATSNYFAADFDLGFPKGHASPTASADLTALVAGCHRLGVRFFADVVMAFATRYTYRYVNFLDFHVHRGTGDPEEDARDDFGGDLFKYNFWTDGYDPIAGETARLVPARRLLLSCLARWLLAFPIA